MHPTTSLQIRLLNFATALLLAAPASSIAGEGATKKGVGLPERHGYGLPHLTALKVSWYYNWGPQTNVQSRVSFVPMIFSPKTLDAKTTGDYVLGYNEPDNAKQANIEVAEALAAWPKIIAKAKFVGSPAMAGNPLTKDWLTLFLRDSPKVDFITVHWYKGADSRHFIKDMEEIHEKFKKPIWVTEFAPQTAESSKENPGKFTQPQVDAFIAETTQWMERTPYILRFAWHDSKAGTSALFNEKGQLTATGKAYANAR